MLEKQLKRKKRHLKIRKEISGTSEKPRLCVFKSANHIYGQIIDDEKKKTLVSANDFDLKGKKTEKAKKVGELLAEKALKLEIKKVVFDKGGFKYIGRVKALAEGAREKGLIF